MWKYLAFVFLLAVGSLTAQVSSSGVQYVSVAPSGACRAGAKIQQVVTGAGGTYTCQSISGGNGTWTVLSSSSASGTVTSATIAGTSGQLNVAGTCTITTTGTCTISIPSSFYTNASFFPFQSITTTGTSGAATLSGGVLNIPQYPGSGLSGMTATQIPIAATASTITSSIATTNPTYFPFQSVSTTGSSGPASLSAGVLNIPQYGGGLPTGVLCSPLLNTSGSTTYATDSLMCDVLTFPGSTFDVKENNANAFAMTTGFSNLDARSANTLAGSQTVASQMNVGRLPAPSLTTSGSGSSLTNVAYYLVYCLDSTIYPNCPGTNDVSSESTITPTAGQNIVVASPTYPGAATTYSVAMATTSDSELYCTAATGVSVGSPATLSAACSGAAITKATSNASVILYTPASCVWNVSITDGVSYGLMVGGRGGVVGTGMGEGQPCRLHPASSATNVAAMWGSDPNPITGTAGGSYVSLAGFGAINNVSGATVPYTFIGQLTFDSSSFTNLDNVNQFGVSNWIWGTKDGTQVINLHGEGSSVSTGDVCQIGKAGMTTQATEFHGLACVHPGSGHHAINYLQSGNNNLFFDTYMESMAGAGCDTTTPLVDLATTGGTAGPVVFDGLTLGAVCSGSVAPVVQIESGLTNYRISNLYGTTDLHAIVDNSYGPGVTCASSPCIVMDYGFSNLGVFNFNGATFARGGATIGTPTGGAEGAGTLNATGLYINGSAVGTGGPGTGTQYDPAGWATTSTLGSIAPTSGYDAVPQVQTATTTSGAFTALPSFVPPGVVPNAQTGTTYTYLLTDRMKYVSFSNASSIAVTLPAAGGTGFGLNFVNVSCDIGAGTATITPTTSTISYSTGSAYTSAASTMALTTGQCAWIYSDNTNYFAIKFSGGSGGDTITSPNSTLAVGGTATNTTLDLNLANANTFTAIQTLPLEDKAGQVFNVKAYGATGNNSTDDSTDIAAAITAATTNGGIVYFPPGNYVVGCTGTNTQLTLPSGVFLVGASQGSSILKACSTMPLTQHVIETANWLTTNCEPGTTTTQYSSCPSNFGIFSLTVDANQSGRGGTGAGNGIAIRGLRYWLNQVDALNAPNDGIYSEMIGGTNSPPYVGASAINYGNASIWYNVRSSNNKNNGIEFYGPPDSILTSVIPFSNSNFGFLNGCLAGSVTSGANSGVCGANIYLSNFHAFKNASGLEIETWTQGNNIQSESNTGSYGIDINTPTFSAVTVSSFTGTSGTLTFTNSGTNRFLAGSYVMLSGFTGGNTGLNGQSVSVLTAGLTATTFEAAVTGSGYSSGAGSATLIVGGANYGILMGTALQTWNNNAAGAGIGLNINSPPASYTGQTGNVINGIQSWANGGYGLVGTTTTTKNQINGSVIMGNNVNANSGQGGISWSASDSQFADMIVKLNTGNGLDFSGSSNLAQSFFAGEIEGNTGTQMLYPTGATNSLLRLSLFASGSETYTSGSLPAGLSTQLLYNGLPAPTVTSNGGGAGAFTQVQGTGGIGGATSGTGGAGGDFLVTTGTGGAATAGSTTGRGGNAVFTLGSAGGTGTAGAPGQFEVVGGTVGAANATPFVNVTGTWNTTGVVDAAFFENVTNSASGAGSLLMDLQLGGSSQFKVDKAGNGTFTSSVTAGGQVLGLVTVVDSSTPVTVSTTNYSEWHHNENATAGTAITYDLPTAAASKQFCFDNAYNGSAANTGTLELLTSAAGQFIIFTDGTLSATGGYVISAGAARDSACLVGVDSTHWMLFPTSGTWTKH